MDKNSLSAGLVSWQQCDISMETQPFLYGLGDVATTGGS